MRAKTTQINFSSFASILGRSMNERKRTELETSRNFRYEARIRRIWPKPIRHITSPADTRHDEATQTHGGSRSQWRTRPPSIYQSITDRSEVHRHSDADTNARGVSQTQRFLINRIAHELLLYCSSVASPDKI